eukprot:TRINITY_DN16382_c1_g2_i1.p1 TRINITY_DN16382_c1_g2~~TRINITY_DN16382_c1_g2_i1.p1  ORF type:complete len:666 (+),score=120.72 TRINITY_DN16382_c1_g2_i1:80-2077(+)
MSFAEDVRDIQANPPENVIAVEVSDYNLEVTLLNPCESFTLVFPDGYKTSYPKGEVSAVIYSNYEELKEGRLRDLIAQLNQKISCRVPREGTMSSDNFGEEDEELDDDSDGMLGAPSMEIDYEQPPHPQFLKDVQYVKDRYGPDFIDYDELKFLDTVVVTLRLQLDYLDGSVCRAWGLAPKKERKPLCLKLSFSRTGYIETSKHDAECYQEGREWCGLAGQLTRIIKNLLETLWKEQMSRGKPPPGLGQLVEMGFPEDKARETLDACEGDFVRASQFLAEGKDPVTVGKKKQKKTEGDGDDKKRIPIKQYGLLVQIMDYAHHRIPTCSEFCVICDKHHVFSSGAMLKASVCTREVCAFAFQQLKVGADAAQDIATDAGVVDLLVVLAKYACESSRWTLIFEPFPTIFDPDNPSKKILHPDKKNIEYAREIFKSFPKVRQLIQADAALEMKQRMDETSKWAYPLLQWIISSNTSHLVKLRSDSKQMIKSISTPHQFLMLSASLEKQNKFNELKKRHKTIFAFHGSSCENWHSILRNGLYNASGTKHQVNGAAHGAGIYLSPSASVSYGYSQLGVSENSSNSGRKNKDTDRLSDEFISEGFGCVAICEVVDHDIRRTGDIWVQPHSDHVVTRFFFAFDSNHQPNKYLNTEDKVLVEELRAAIETFQQ